MSVSGQPAPFVLLHGAFRGGWAWSRVRTVLVAAGHDVHAPSLLGCGDREPEGHRVLHLSDWVEQIVRLVEAEDLRDVVLVGHSQAGIVSRGVAARIPDRLASVVHLDAAITDPGERAVDLTPAPGELPPRETTISPRPLVEGAFADDAWVDWVNARLGPTPFGPSLDVVDGPTSGVREVAVFCDGTPPGYPSTVSRARMDERRQSYVRLECGHDAPIEAPELVAELLLAVAAGVEVTASGRAQG